MVVENAMLFINCTKCSYHTKSSSEMTNHYLKTHALEATHRIFEGQVSKLMSKENLMDSYGFEVGSLKEIFTDNTERSFHVVQVLALNPDFIHISDGSCIVTNCVAACDVTEIQKAKSNCVIKINKWSVIQIIPKGEPGQRKKQSEYGIKIESFEILESRRTLPILGNPKVIHVTIILDEKTDLDQIVIDLLENIISNEDLVMETKKEWCQKMLKILKKNENIGMWQCTVCRSRLSDKMDEKVVSHAQLHLRFFPGYRCPAPHKCKSETLLKYNKHLDESGHDMIQPEPPEKVDKPVTEEAEVGSKGETQVSSVLEELTSCFESEFGERDECETNSLDVVNEEDEEEDLEEVTESVADVLEDFLSIHNLDEEEGTSAQHGTEPSCDKKQTLSKEGSENQHISNTRSTEGESILPYETEAIAPIVTLESTEPSEYVEYDEDSKSQDISKTKSNEGESVTNDSKVTLESESYDPEVTLEVQSNAMGMIRDDSVIKSKMSEEIEEVSISHNLETSSSKVAQSPSKTPPLRSPMVKEAPRDATVLADSENESNSPKFDWMRDVSSKIMISSQHYECAECGLKNREQREILDHLSDFHLQRFREFTCMICRIQSHSLRDFLDHLKTEHKKKPSRDFKRAVTETQNIGSKRKIIEVDLDSEVNSDTLSKKSKCTTNESKKREVEVMKNHLKILEDNLSKKDSPKEKNMKETLPKKDSLKENIRREILPRKSKNSTNDFKKRDEGVMENQLKILEDRLSKKNSPKEKNMRETQSQNQDQPFNWHREMTKSVAITKNKIKCLQCSAQLGSSNSAVSHLESFHFKELKDLKCPHCDIICDSLVNYNSHVRMKHRVKLTLSLNKKNLSAIDESSSMALINKSLVHNTSTTRPDGFLWQNEVMKRIKLSRGIYHCSDCEFKSKPLSKGGGVEILNHIEAQHMGVTGYSCPECLTVINNFINFFQHLNKSHKIRLRLLQIL